VTGRKDRRFQAKPSLFPKVALFSGERQEMAATTKLGDVGEGKVIASLLAQGFKVALPISSDLPIDLIALDPENGWRTIRIQVKAQSAYKGKTEVSLKNCSSTRKGLKYRFLDKRAIDVGAVYCPEVDQVAYIPVAEIEGRTVSLRLDATRNCQAKGVRYFRDYSSLKQAVSSETIRPTPD
jgi:hypothetical protein